MKRWHSVAAIAVVAASGAVSAAEHEVAPLPPLRERASTTRLALFHADVSADAPQPAEALATPPLATDPQKLTLADAERIALANHPSLARAAARVMAARGSWVQAGLPPNPTVGYMGGEIGNETRPGNKAVF